MTCCVGEIHRHEAPYRMAGMVRTITLAEDWANNDYIETGIIYGGNIIHSFEITYSSAALVNVCLNLADEKTGMEDPKVWLNPLTKVTPLASAVPVSSSEAIDLTLDTGLTHSPEITLTTATVNEVLLDVLKTKSPNDPLLKTIGATNFTLGLVNKAGKSIAKGTKICYKIIVI